MSEPITEQYRPETYDEIQGNNKSLRQIREWAENWSEGDSPQLLHGEPGTGKTTTAMVTADHMGYPLNEFNTSDARRSEDIEEICQAIVSTPTNAEHQLILLDETDSWHHASSKKKLYDALDNPGNPVIMTANVKYDVPSGLKSRSKLHKFSLQKRSRKSKLKEIVESEDLDLSTAQIDKLSERPDLRTVLNDLEDYAEHGSFRDTRVWTESEFDALQNLLGGNGRDWKESLSVRSDTFDKPDDVLLWADENVSSEWRGFELGIAYKLMRDVDTSLGRAQSEQAYRYWKYATAILSVLPETRLTKPYDGYIRSNFPSWFQEKSKKYDDGSPESKLFQKLKGEGYSFSGSYYEFRKQIIPILEDMPDEEKYDFAVDNGLEGDELEPIGLNESDFDDYRMDEPTVGDGWTPDTEQASVMDW